MSRLDNILKYIDKSSLGIEVAPYFNPALPKAKGNKVLILDVFDTNALRDYAAKDPLIDASRLSEIEEVDVVGDASSIGDMVAEKGLSGQLAFVISSHNFEHLPNPIKFLRGCSTALRPGGMISMAVPDCRACFDYFRFPTRLSDWLYAYHNNADKPRPEQIFDLDANRSAFFIADKSFPGCNIALDNPENFRLTGDLPKAYADYQTRIAAPYDYFDTHCTIMFPETLELMLRDLRQLGLIDLEVVEIAQSVGHEFFVHLRKPLQETPAVDPVTHQAKRAELLRAISQRIGAAPYTARAQNRSLGQMVTYRLKSLVVAVIGQGRYDAIRLANRNRRTRRRAANKG